MEILKHVKFNTNFKRNIKHFPESIGRWFCNIIFLPIRCSFSKNDIKKMETIYQEILTGSLTAIGYGIIFGFFLGVMIYIISLNK